jgi:hypothetical protein
MIQNLLCANFHVLRKIKPLDITLQNQACATTLHHPTDRKILQEKSPT